MIFPVAGPEIVKVWIGTTGLGQKQSIASPEKDIKDGHAMLITNWETMTIY